MTFEPTAQDCINPITGKLCPAYRTGDGKSTISRCLVEETPGQINPPEWCPMLKGTSSSTDNQKDGLEDEISGVTPKLGAVHSPKNLIPCECGCGKYFEERGNKRFFNRHHKDNFTNRSRLEARKKLVTMALAGKTTGEAMITMADEILRQFGTDK